MSRKKILEPPLRAEVDAALDQSASAFREGDLHESLRLAHQAWDLLPEPKEDWDYYPQSLAVGFVQDYTDLGNIEAVREWVEKTYLAYRDPEHTSLYVLMLEGEALFKLGLNDEAYGVFERVFELYGRDGFPGAHREYLEFYLKQRAQRDA